MNLPHLHISAKRKETLITGFVFVAYSLFTFGAGGATAVYYKWVEKDNILKENANLVEWHKEDKITLDRVRAAYDIIALQVKNGQTEQKAAIARKDADCNAALLAQRDTFSKIALRRDALVAELTTASTTQRKLIGNLLSQNKNIGTQVKEVQDKVDDVAADAKKAAGKPVATVPAPAVVPPKKAPAPEKGHNFWEGGS